MAKMIPDLLPETIENDGERMFYSIARELPDGYTVLYSYKSEILILLANLSSFNLFIFVSPLGYYTNKIRKTQLFFNKMRI